VTTLRVCKRRHKATDLSGEQPGEFMMRWLAVREARVVESDDAVKYRNVDGRLERLALRGPTPAK